MQSSQTVEPHDPAALMIPTTLQTRQSRQTIAGNHVSVSGSNQESNPPLATWPILLPPLSTQPTQTVSMAPPQLTSKTSKKTTVKAEKSAKVTKKNTKSNNSVIPHFLYEDNPFEIKTLEFLAFERAKFAHFCLTSACPKYFNSFFSIPYPLLNILFPPTHRLFCALCYDSFPEETAAIKDHQQQHLLFFENLKEHCGDHFSLHPFPPQQSHRSSETAISEKQSETTCNVCCLHQHSHFDPKPSQTDVNTAELEEKKKKTMLLHLTQYFLGLLPTDFVVQDSTQLVAPETWVKYSHELTMGRLHPTISRFFFIPNFNAPNTTYPYQSHFPEKVEKATSASKKSEKISDTTEEATTTTTTTPPTSTTIATRPQHPDLISQTTLPDSLSELAYELDEQGLEELYQDFGSAPLVFQKKDLLPSLQVFYVSRTAIPKLNVITQVMAKSSTVAGGKRQPAKSKAKGKKGKNDGDDDDFEGYSAGMGNSSTSANHNGQNGADDDDHDEKAGTNEAGDDGMSNQPAKKPARKMKRKPIGAENTTDEEDDTYVVSKRNSIKIAQQLKNYGKLAAEATEIDAFGQPVVSTGHNSGSQLPSRRSTRTSSRIVKYFDTSSEEEEEPTKIVAHYPMDANSAHQQDGEDENDDEMNEEQDDGQESTTSTTTNQQSGIEHGQTGETHGDSTVDHGESGKTDATSTPSSHPLATNPSTTPQIANLNQSTSTTSQTPQLTQIPTPSQHNLPPIIPAHHLSATTHHSFSTTTPTVPKLPTNLQAHNILKTNFTANPSMQSPNIHNQVTSLTNKSTTPTAGNGSISLSSLLSSSQHLYPPLENASLPQHQIHLQNQLQNLSPQQNSSSNHITPHHSFTIIGPNGQIINQLQSHQIKTLSALSNNPSLNRLANLPQPLSTQNPQQQQQQQQTLQTQQHQSMQTHLTEQQQQRLDQHEANTDPLPRKVPQHQQQPSTTQQTTAAPIQPPPSAQSSQPVDGSSPATNGSRK